MSTPSIGIEPQDRPRRVVTTVRDGKSVISSDGIPPNAHVHISWPGHMTSVCWATGPDLTLPMAEAEPAPAGIRVTPKPGETRLMIVRFPPDQVFASPDYNPVAAASEQATHVPGLAERFEVDSPGMHTTDSVDYGIVIEGEIWLELDDGVEVHLRRGDVLVQGGTRHAWRNKGTQAATLAFVLLGAARLGASGPAAA